MLVSGAIAKRWLERHGGARIHSRIDHVGHLERDASEEQLGERLRLEDSAPAPVSAPSAGAASSFGIVIELAGAKAVEEAVGARYRKELARGIGFDFVQGVSTEGRYMKARLRTWGYEVSREACQDLLESSRQPV